MQGLQGGVTILCGGSFVHVPEALHGRDVALDALFGNVEFGNEAQQATVVTVEEHRAAVVALQVKTHQETSPQHSHPALLLCKP